MSRSYHHNFWFVVDGDKKNKKRYNKRFRQISDQDFPSGSGFKKRFNSYKIRNWALHYDDEEAFVRANLPYLRSGETESDLRKTWRKHFLSK